MYSAEQRKLAIETHIRFDLSVADTIAVLGYPTRSSLRAWYKDYLEHGVCGKQKVTMGDADAFPSQNLCCESQWPSVLHRGSFLPTISLSRPRHINGCAHREHP